MNRPRGEIYMYLTAYLARAPDSMFKCSTRGILVLLVVFSFYPALTVQRKLGNTLVQLSNSLRQWKERETLGKEESTEAKLAIERAVGIFQEVSNVAIPQIRHYITD